MRGHLLLLHRDDRRDKPLDAITGAAEMNEWVSVKDQLPEKEGQYLVLVKDKKDRNEIIISSFEKQWVTEENTAFRYVKVLSLTPMFELYFYSKVTHWMPIPEPPK